MMRMNPHQQVIHVMTRKGFQHFRETLKDRSIWPSLGQAICAVSEPFRFEFDTVEEAFKEAQRLRDEGFNARLFVTPVDYQEA